MAKGSVRSSMILIAAGERLEVYRSLQDVPGELREKLLDATNRSESATILIADKRGREEIAKAVQGLPEAVRLRILEAWREDVEESLPPPLRFRHLRWLRWLLAGAAALICWLALEAGSK